MDNPWNTPLDWSRLPPNASKVANNRIDFGHRMGFGKDRIIGLIVDGVMERCFPPFAATMEDYEFVQAWAPSVYETDAAFRAFVAEDED